jgi:uncharacterized protein
MQQYIIYARDGADPEAPGRRLKNRTAHFENARKMKANGNFIFGGAILDNEGKMTGSVMIVQFETTEELQRWLDSEPYIIGKVWGKFEIHPFKAADIEKYFLQLNK